MELLWLREDTAPTVDGRTLVTRVCTYGKAYNVGGKRERIKAGAFKSPVARPSGLLRYRHIGERPGDLDDPTYVYGSVRVLRDDQGGLIAEADVIDGSRGDHLLSLVTSGAITGVSMSAMVADSHMARDAAGALREVTRIGQFYGISLTPSPAYEDAGVLALREFHRDVKRIEQERAKNLEVRKLLTGMV